MNVKSHHNADSLPGFGPVEWLVGGGVMGNAVRAFDWSTTPLGPRALWPQSLRIALGLCLNSRFPMFVWWGPDLINIYNDAYSPMLGHRHPLALGRPAKQTWSDLWPALALQVEAVFDRGEASWNERVGLVTNRKGYDEEAYFTFSYSPAFDEQGKVAGLVCAVVEETAHVLTERRQALLVEISDLLRGLNKPGDIVAAAVNALGRHLKVNRAGYGQVQADDESIVLESSYASGVKPITGTFPLDSFGADNIVRQRRGITVVCNDVAADLSSNPDTWAAIETRAFVSVPLVYAGRWRASLYVNQRESRFWQAEEVHLIEDVAARIWEALKRARASEEERKSEERLAFAFQAGGGVGTWDWDLVADRLSCNASFAYLFSVDPERAAKGAPVSEFLPGIHSQDCPGVVEKIANACKAGGDYMAEYRVVLKNHSTRWVHARGRVELDDAGVASHFAGVLFDITERKVVALRDAFLVRLDDATRPLTDSDTMTQTAARMVCEHLDVDRCAYADVDDETGTFHVTGDYNRNVPSIVGRYTIEQFGKEFARTSRANEPFVIEDVEADASLSDVLESYRQTRIRSVISVPLHKDGRFVAGMAVHQTTARSWRPDEVELLQLVANRCWESLERGRIERKLREAEERLRLIVDDVPGLVCYLDRDLRYQFINRVYSEWFGPESETFVGKTLLEVVGPDIFEKARPFLEQALQGNPVRFDEFFPYERCQGRHVQVSYMPQRSGRGSVQGIVALVQDITERKNAEEERNSILAREQEARQTAELLNQIGPVLTAELDTQKLASNITDIATKLTGAKFGALFHTAKDEEGESLLLYTLSGIDRQAFAGFPMPRNTHVFGPTFRNEGVLRSDDILADPRYGKNPPYSGMPKGHVPVRSYLAVSVVSRTGQVLGALIFGHPQPARFTEAHERIVSGIAAQAAIALDNARLFSESQDTQRALLRSNNELRAANADLEQFAYAASHDLKEPLRMVAIYSQILKRKYYGKLDAEADEYLEITINGAKRMEALVADLFAYMQAVTTGDDDVPAVASEAVLDEALSNLNRAIEESGAIINRASLPQLRVKETHLLQLFQNLIGNAIKYRGRQAPAIQIKADREGNLWRLCVHDNGIGIQPEYQEQVFGLFKRLHTSEKYTGTGMGLAICQKIVHRYGGRIWVESKGAGQGSTFCFTLPGAE